MRNVLIILGIIVFLLFVFFFTRSLVRRDNGIGFLGGSQTVKIQDKTFNVTVRDDDTERQQGLSGRNSLAENAGMLFTYTRAGYYPFWMKNMKFPIDIIFIRDNKIVTIHKNVKAPEKANSPLPSYISSSEADKVLEINAGLSDKYGFKVGDTVTVSL